VWDVHETLLLIRPLEHTLRGVLLERSGAPDCFYVNVFLQPLFIPEQHYVLNAGWRLGGGAHAWNVAAPSVLGELRQALTHQAFPFLEPIKSPRDVALATKLMNRSADPIVLRMVAYGFARHGDIRQATHAIDQLLTLLAGDDRHWVRAMYDQAASLHAALLKHPARAERLLLTWETQTAKALGLERFRSTSECA
jgi:hypothetical protein